MTAFAPSPGDNDPAVCIKGFVPLEPAWERPRAMMLFIFPLSPPPRGGAFAALELALPVVAFHAGVVVPTASPVPIAQVLIPPPPIKQAGSGAAALSSSWGADANVPPLASIGCHTNALNGARFRGVGGGVIRLICGLLANILTARQSSLPTVVGGGAD